MGVDLSWGAFLMHLAIDTQENLLYILIAIYIPYILILYILIVAFQISKGGDTGKKRTDPLAGSVVIGQGEMVAGLQAPMMSCRLGTGRGGIFWDILPG